MNQRKEINYIKTPNQGKTTAINIGLQHAKGELFFIVESNFDIAIFISSPLLLL